MSSLRQDGVDMHRLVEELHKPGEALQHSMQHLDQRLLEGKLPVAGKLLDHREGKMPFCLGYSKLSRVPSRRVSFGLVFGLASCQSPF